MPASVRRSICAKCCSRGRVVAARTQEDCRQIRMLEGGCNNLNQLARLAHQQGMPSGGKVAIAVGRV